MAEARVKPERQKQKRSDLRDRWWRFAYRKKALYDTIQGQEFVLSELRSVRILQLPDFLPKWCTQILS